MNYRKLGNTELNVSTICLGTMTWGEQNNQKEAFDQMDYAVDQGINFFDTAELYAVPMKPETRGKTSQIIGEWFLKTKKRNKIIFFLFFFCLNQLPIISSVFPYVFLFGGIA